MDEMAGKSTRDILKEAYQESLSLICDRKKLRETPADLAERERIAEIFRSAESLLSLNILNETVTKEYELLGTRIREKNAELEQLYGITLSPESPEAIAGASASLADRFAQETQQNESVFSAERERRDAEAEIAINEITAASQALVASAEQELAALRATFKQDFDRESSEYDYTLKRERKKAQEERAAMTDSREKALRLRETEAKERKAVLTKKLEEIQSLQKAVDNIPRQLEQAKAGGADETEKSLKKTYGYQKSLDEKDRKNRIDALNEELSRLTRKFEALQKEKAELSKRLDQCNAESRQLTSDTVRSIGGINILSGDSRPAASAAKK